MIRILLNGPISAVFGLDDVDFESRTYKIEGKEPSVVFDRLLNLNWDWTLEISEDEADLELAKKWEMADISARIARALQHKKMIVLEMPLIKSRGVAFLQSMDEAVECLVEFCGTFGHLPVVVCDNSEELKLGFEPSEVSEASS
jgi:hypothetical protein